MFGLKSPGVLEGRGRRYTNGNPDGMVGHPGAGDLGDFADGVPVKAVSLPDAELMGNKYAPGRGAYAKKRGSRRGGKKRKNRHKPTRGVRRGRGKRGGH